MWGVRVEIEAAGASVGYCSVRGRNRGVAMVVDRL